MSQPNGKPDPVDVLRGMAKTVRDYRGHAVSSKVLNLVASDQVFDAAADELAETRRLVLKQTALIDKGQASQAQMLATMEEGHKMLQCATYAVKELERRQEVTLRRLRRARIFYRVLCAALLSACGFLLLH